VKVDTLPSKCAFAWSVSGRYAGSGGLPGVFTFAADDAPGTAKPPRSRRAGISSTDTIGFLKILPRSFNPSLWSREWAVPSASSSCKFHKSPFP